MTALLLGVLLAASPVKTTLPKVAAPDWSLVKIDSALGGFYADHLSQAMRTQGFQVVTSKDISALIGQERQKQLLGCSDESTSCLAELGNALGCDGMLMVSLAKLDDSFRGTVRIVSSVDAKVMAETLLEASSEKGLLASLDEAAEQLASKLGPEPKKGSASSLRSLAWVPAAIAGLGVGAAIGGFAVAGDKAEKIQKANVNADVSSEVRDGKTFQAIGFIGAGVGVAALVTAGVMFFTGGNEAPVTPSVQVSASGASIGLSGAF